MRKLTNIIDEMLNIIPENENEIIAFLEDIKESQKVRSPEDMTGWYQISKMLDRMLNEFYAMNKTLRKINIPEWKLKLFNIFTTQPLEEVKRDIYGEEYL